MTTLTVALEALTHDSAQWQGTADTLTRASASAEALVLSDNQLSWASQDELLATYEQLRAKVAMLLKEGADETAKIGRTLLHVKQIYESADRRAKNHLHGVWDIKR